jgi:hypothetical protein
MSDKATAPMGNSCLDQVASMVTYTDPQPAEIDLLQQAWSIQWRTITAWGCPDVWMGVELDDGGVVWDVGDVVYKEVARTTYVRILVPPLVEWAEFVILASGRGKFTITSGTDSTGTSRTYNVGNSVKLSSAKPFYQTGMLPTSAGAASGRAIQVVSNVRPYWQTEDLTITLTMTDENSALIGYPNGHPAKIHGMGVHWVRQPQDITGSKSV